MKYMMLDIETTGIDFNKNQVLQICFLELFKNKSNQYVPGRMFNRLLNYDGYSAEEWARKNNADLLDKCSKVPYQAPVVVKCEILNFFNQCNKGSDEKPGIMGLNVGSFDLPFLKHHGFLGPEDYHYRVYELRGAYNLATDVLGPAALKDIGNACAWLDLPVGKAHDGMWDCYNQLKTLNGIIATFQNMKASMAEAVASGQEPPTSRGPIL